MGCNRIIHLMWLKDTINCCGCWEPLSSTVARAARSALHSGHLGVTYTLLRVLLYRQKCEEIDGKGHTHTHTQRERETEIERQRETDRKKNTDINSHSTCHPKLPKKKFLFATPSNKQKWCVK